MTTGVHVQDQDEPKTKKRAPRKTKAKTVSTRGKKPKATVNAEEVKPQLRLLLEAISTKCITEDDKGVLSVGEAKKVHSAFKALGGEDWAKDMMEQLDQVLGEYSNPKKIQAVVWPF